MNKTLQTPEPPADAAHREILALLPWYVNETLDGEELVRVQTHVASCLACYREVAALRALARAVARTPTPPADPEAAWAKLADRIERRLPAARRKTRPGIIGWPGRRHGPGTKTGWLRPAIAAPLAAAILVLAWQQVQRFSDPGFRTLGTPSFAVAPAAGDIRVIFARDIPPERIDAVLADVGAVRVQGPDSAGVYTVRLNRTVPEKAAADALLAELRRVPGVLFAEPASR